MYLKRLEIKGFKSFADITEINLKPGINIVVGPNGCGKSNIVDAIRWVLGETNVRHIRGQKNEDIIFNGTDKKKSQGMAYAEITVDNHDHVLPVDYNEVTVERKSFRSGESEFTLNKARVRMKDITQLFTGTGLGKKGYSIINQGELEQVLNGQPLERRLILEEASGIIRHRYKRDEVQKRLLITSNDILRLGDILGELEKRKEEVYEKAEKAEKYLTIAQHHDKLERLILTYEWLKVNQDVNNRKSDFAVRQVHINEAKAAIELMEKELQQIEASLQENNLDLTRLREKKHIHESTVSGIKSEIRLGQEKLKNAKERIFTADNDSEKYLVMLNSLSRDIEETIIAHEQDQEQFAQRQMECQQVEKEVLLFSEKIQRHEGQFEVKRAETFANAQEETEISNKIVAHEEELKRSREKSERIGIHLEDVRAKQIANKTMVTDLREQITLHEQQELDFQISLKELHQQKEQLQKKEDELTRLNDNYRNQIQTVTNLHNANQEMQRNLSGYSSGVKAIVRRFTTGDNKIPGYIGIIGELIDVKPGLETAVEIALNRSLENIVVENIDDARKAISILKEQKMGRVTFLPLDALRSKSVSKVLLEKMQKIEGVLGLGSELVDYDPRYKKAVEYLLGRVLIVENVDIAIKIHKNIDFPGRIVTLEGELINASGAITGGSRATSQMGVIQRKGEEKKLAQSLKELQAKATDNLTALELQKQKLKDLNQIISQVKNSSIEQNFKLEILAKQKEKVETESSALQRQRDSYLEQLNQIDKDIVRLKENSIKWQEEKSILQAKSEILTNELELIKQSIETDSRDLEVGKERFNSYKEQLEMKRKELENSCKNITQFEQVKQSYQQSLEAAALLKERMQIAINAENESIEQKRQTVVEYERELQAVINSIENAGKRSGELKSEIEQSRQQLIPQRQNLALAENSHRNLELTIARLETEHDNLLKKWQEKYNENLLEEQLTVTCNSADIRGFIKETAELKEEMERLWPVDIKAVEEYEEISARFAFQKQQHQDLMQARDSLQKLLEETEKIMMKDFSHFLLLANESFKGTFKEMFGGGEAVLRLDHHNEKLDAGVEIEVKMPGKKMQSLDLLSGGERALTCIAFIFALLGLKPAPFCLLDEIDASLDETNLIRFSNFLQKMSDNMQFIIITHRQTTIAAGENIYGVTMPEKGISSVLTLNIQEAENLAG